MSEQSSTNVVLDDGDLSFGVKLLVVGIVFFHVGSSWFDFVVLPSQNAVSYADLSGRNFMTTVWLLVIIWCGVGYQRASDKASKKAVWQYRGAVWFGGVYLALPSFLVLSWYLVPGRALKAYFSSQAKLQGFNPDLVEAQIDFNAASETMSFGWWAGATILLGLALAAIGILIIQQYNRGHRRSLDQE